jgi:hypothetical protein
MFHLGVVIVMITWPAFAVFGAVATTVVGDSTMNDAALAPPK